MREEVHAAVGSPAGNGREYRGERQELRSGRISSVELTRTALDRIEAHNTALNAVVTVTAELALKRRGEPTGSFVPAVTAGLCTGSRSG